MTSGIMDVVAIYALNKFTLSALMVVIGLALFFKGSVHTRRMILVCIAALVFSEVFVSSLKLLIERVRPCHVLEGVRVVAGCSDSFSLPSRHTTHIFTLMTVLSFFKVRYTPLFLCVAAIVGYSRVYAGAHYPSDVLVGALLGAFIAIVVCMIDRKLTFFDNLFPGGIKTR
jgi:undecaprenyl-diphosphatase